MPSARHLLGPEGPLAKSFGGYELREGQLAMADAVERALGEDRVLLCEAGTGTGKTLAYLVPAILSGRKVVVSTATKALQEQIYDHDLPLVRQMLGLDPKAALVKGLGNYLCRRRYQEFRASGDALTPKAARSLDVVERWIESTESGDVAELDALGEDDPLWGRIGSSSETRVGSGCTYYESCFVTRMKRQAEEARLLVVNHHLFFADLALKGEHPGGALPPYDAVIFDEAHQIEDIATSFFGVRVSSARVASLVRDATIAFGGRRRDAKGGATGRGSRHLTSRTERGALDAPLSTGIALAERAQAAADQWFADLATMPQRLGARGAHAGRGAQGDRGAAGGRGAPSDRAVSGEGRVTLDRSMFSGDVVAHYHRLDETLEALAACAEADNRSEAVEMVARRSKQLRDDLAAIVDGSHNQVTWLELRARSASLGMSPVDLSHTLRSRLFDRIPAVVLTSATLTTVGGFSFIRSRLGIEESQIASPVEELEVKSPFDFASRAMLYVPRDLPEPGDPQWIEKAAPRIAELIAGTGGGAFVLCTSYRTMHALYAELGQRTLLPLMLQGEAPKAALLERFRAEGDAVLVATSSFWEGVDVPGRALRLVVLEKIPFLVPSDPIVVARSTALEDAGQNAFTRYHVPSAALLLKQGFGRLIRTRADAGVVALLDGRVHRRGYGRALIASLPDASRTDRLEDVLAFIAAGGIGPSAPREDAAEALH